MKPLKGEKTTLMYVRHFVLELRRTLKEIRFNMSYFFFARLTHHIMRWFILERRIIMFNSKTYSEVIIAHNLEGLDALSRAMRNAYYRDKYFSYSVYEHEGLYIVELKTSLSKKKYIRFMDSIHKDGYNLKQLSGIGIINEIVR